MHSFRENELFNDGSPVLQRRITSAVYHATGIRHRDIPVRIEDILPMPMTNIA
jgi:hypothetical protein